MPLWPPDPHFPLWWELASASGRGLGGTSSCDCSGCSCSGRRPRSRNIYRAWRQSGRSDDNSEFLFLWRSCCILDTEFLPFWQASGELALHAECTKMSWMSCRTLHMSELIQQEASKESSSNESSHVSSGKLHHTSCSHRDGRRLGSQRVGPEDDCDTQPWLENAPHSDHRQCLYGGF